MKSIADECKNILKAEGINLASSIEFDVNGKLYPLTFEYIIDSYTQASKESQEVFLKGLKKSLDLNNDGIEKFFESMGQLLLMTHLSDKFEA